MTLHTHNIRKNQRIAARAHNQHSRKMRRACASWVIANVLTLRHVDHGGGWLGSAELSDISHYSHDLAWPVLGDPTSARIREADKKLLANRILTRKVPVRHGRIDHGHPGRALVVRDRRSTACKPRNPHGCK